MRIVVTSLDLPLDRVEVTQAAAHHISGRLVFTARDGPSMVRSKCGNYHRRTASPAAPPHPPEFPTLEGSVGLLRVTLGDRKFSYDNFIVSAGPPLQVNFSGSVSLDGALDLVARIPEQSTGLAAGSSLVAVTGTIDARIDEARSRQ